VPARLAVAAAFAAAGIGGQILGIRGQTQPQQPPPPTVALPADMLPAADAPDPAAAARPVGTAQAPTDQPRSVSKRPANPVQPSRLPPGSAVGLPAGTGRGTAADSQKR
ncbi:MAG: hypothetical protein ABI564_13605, partial [Ideonella sp.]